MAESDDVAEIYSSWLTPREALSLLPEDWAYQTKIRWIAERLRGNLIHAAANAYHRDGNSVAEQSIVLVPPDRWQSWACLADGDFWANGDVSFSSNTRGRGIKFFAVRLDPERFLPFTALPRQPSPPNPVEIIRHDAFEPAKPKAGGRPRNEYWEPLLIEMARQLFSGDLQPKRQADIENAMHDWLAANGHKGGETQVRQRARSLWEAIQK